MPFAGECILEDVVSLVIQNGGRQVCAAEDLRPFSMMTAAGRGGQWIRGHAGHGSEADRKPP
jgi:hypothetical protein